MKRYLYTFTALLAIFLSFLGGAFYGFKEGMNNYLHLGKVLSSNVDVLRAKDIRSGEERRLKHVFWHFQTSINEGIDSYNWYRDSGNHLFSRFFLSGHVDQLDESIKNIATYRLNDPIDDQIDIMLCELPRSAQDGESCLRKLEEREKTVRAYGDGS